MYTCLQVATSFPVVQFNVLCLMGQSYQPLFTQLVSYIRTIIMCRQKNAYDSKLVESRLKLPPLQSFRIELLLKVDEYKRCKLGKLLKIGSSYQDPRSYFFLSFYLDLQKWRDFLEMYSVVISLL